MKSEITSRVGRKENVIGFGVKDKYGREIGAYIRTCETTLSPLPETANGWFNHAPGHFYELYTQCTRNGETYGACQNSHFFTTQAERDAAIQKYLKTAKAKSQGKSK